MAKLLEGSEYEVVGQMASIDEAIDAVAPDGQPELCLVVYAPGDRKEVERVSRLRTALTGTRIVVLSTLANAGLVGQSLGAGVDAFLLKDMSADSLVRALGLVMMGEMVMPTQLATVLINSGPNFAGMPANGPRRKVHGMSVREAQILRCLVSGGANKVIASRLDITEATVKVHIKGILKKINVSNRTQAAVWAIKHGLAEDVLEAGSG